MKFEKLVLPNLSSDPTGEFAGQLYFNTGTNKVRQFNGSIWSDITAGGGGGPAAPNFIATVKAAVRQTIRMNLAPIPVKVAVRIVTFITARRDIKPAVRIAASAVHSSLVAVKPAVKVRTVFALGPTSTPIKPAANLTQIKYTLDHTSGANAVTEVLGSDGGWTSEANAGGVHNGSDAAFAGQALNARDGTLILAYADFVNKTDLTITQVTLSFYRMFVSGTLLNNAFVRIGYRTDGSTTNANSTVVLATFTGDQASTPLVYDITTDIGGSWTKLNGLVVQVNATAALGELWTAALDAVEVNVLAERTDTL